MSQRQADPQLADHTAQAIKDAFAAYHFDFKDITRQAKERFEQCDWHGLQKDTEMRLDLYKDYVARAIEAIKPDVAAYTSDTSFWAAVKERYSRITMGRHDLELAESFFNSVTMRLATFTGLDPHVQYVGSEFGPASSDTEETAFVTCCGGPSVSALIEGILLDCRFNVDFKDLKQDVALVTEQVESYLWESYQAKEVDSIDIARPIFYRGKGAYLVGRVNTASTYVPLVIALFNDEGGVYVDAVLLTEDEVSIIFSFARSYFHVDVETPHALVGFLKAIMPLKPVAELYISLGYNKHGKTELYRDLMRHMSRSTDKFEIARGERGMVMMVFTLPSYDVVFKVIKDSFDYPKTTTRQEVRNHYHLVFKHDRGGRLVDAQEFEHLRFDKARFSPALLEALLNVAANTVSVEGDEVVTKHLYTERRLVPLNLYVREMDAQAATEAVMDYGQAIKDLAYT